MCRVDITTHTCGHQIKMLRLSHCIFRECWSESRRDIYDFQEIRDTKGGKCYDCKVADADKSGGSMSYGGAQYGRNAAGDDDRSTDLMAFTHSDTETGYQRNVRDGSFQEVVGEGRNEDGARIASPTFTDKGSAQGSIEAASDMATPRMFEELMREMLRTRGLNVGSESDKSIQDEDTHDAVINSPTAMQQDATSGPDEFDLSESRSDKTPGEPKIQATPVDRKRKGREIPETPQPRSTQYSMRRKTTGGNQTLETQLNELGIEHEGLDERLTEINRNLIDCHMDIKHELTTLREFTQQIFDTVLNLNEPKVHSKSILEARNSIVDELSESIMSHLHNFEGRLTAADVWDKGVRRLVENETLDIADMDKLRKTVEKRDESRKKYRQEQFEKMRGLMRDEVSRTVSAFLLDDKWGILKNESKEGSR